MSPWTALLESLHSALIDELTERHPEPKPTLGMPTRSKTLSAPEGVAQVLFCEATFDPAQRGSALLAFDPPFMSAINLPAEDFWQAILKRAGTEFMRRSIRPTLSPPVVMKPPITLPKGFPEPTRVIWIPFEIPAGRCYLGLAA